MKKIKTYEKFIYIDELKKLCDYIVNFFSESNIEYTIENSYSIKFYISIKEEFRQYVKHIFSLILIDYFSGDLDRFFQFKIVRAPRLNSEEVKIVNFLKFIFNKYTNQGMINFNKISNIINDITKENFEFYKSTTQYNL